MIDSYLVVFQSSKTYLSTCQGMHALQILTLSRSNLTFDDLSFDFMLVLSADC